MRQDLTRILRWIRPRARVLDLGCGNGEFLALLRERRDVRGIGREGVVTFPNFGHWRCRLHLSMRGRMPVSRFMPYNWYDTPNIHFCTVRDFEILCRRLGIRILGRDMIGAEQGVSRLARRWPNLFATTAIYHISR